MTDLFFTEKKCAMCGHVEEYRELCSTNQNGYVDLDTRPPETARSALKYDVQLCEECGFSNGDISKKIEGINVEDLNETQYRATFKDNSTDACAKAFLLSGHLYQNAGQFRTAGICFLKAAWVFDDKRKKDHSMQARNRAIENLNKYFDKSSEINLNAVLVDIYRRVGRFEEAEEIAGRLIEQGTEDTIKKILRFQIKLCQKKNPRCHTVKKVLRD